MEEHPNILVINLMKEVKTRRRLKRKLSQDLYATMLFKISINCQNVLANVAQSDSL